MKKIVISGSSKLQDKINYWIEHFKNKNYEILDYPKLIEEDNYMKELPNVYRSFYTSLENTDVFFLMNEEKNGIRGYIGASAIAELTYVIILNLIHNKNIDIYILNMPSEEVSSYDEVKFWLEVGWIKIYKEKQMHDLKLYGENFDRMESGNKQREYRLFDEKRQSIKIGDTIRFIRLPDKDKYLYADVINIEVFKNWYDCYGKYFDEDFKDRYETIQDVVDDTFNGGYYTKEETDKYGCCCLTLSKVRKKQ